MMILQGHRSNSLSSQEEYKISESQQANQFPRKNLKPWARDPPYNSPREANLTPFNTMHMPRLDSPGGQERRSHIPIWEPLYMEDTPYQKEQGGRRQSSMSLETNSLKVELKNPFAAADGDDGIDHGCCAWKLCLTFMTANWMSRAM